MINERVRFLSNEFSTQKKDKIKLKNYHLMSDFCLVERIFMKKKRNVDMNQSISGTRE